MPRADGSRAIGVDDVSGASRAASAMAAGGQALGQGIEKAAQGVASYAQDEGFYEVAKAKSDWLTKDVQVKSGLQHDTDYTTLETRYETDTTKKRDAAAATISSGPQRDAFIQSTNVQIQSGKSVFKEKAFALEGDQNVAWATTQGNNTINAALATDDPAERGKLIQSHNDLIDGMTAKGFIRSTQALQMKQSWAQQFALADGINRAKIDPDGVINDLRAAPGSDAAVTNRILQVEGTAKNGKSSAVGAGQFIDGTWLDVLKRNRPDIAVGKTDTELLSLRADKSLGREMTEAYRAENAAYLTRQGIEATPGNQYLAHFLGAGGAAAVLKANPSAPVLDVLTQAVGAKKAQQMVDANRSILDGQLAGSVKDWADAKMGGATPGGGQIFDFLPPGQRAQLLQHAQVQLDKTTATDASALKTRVEDTLAEAARTGSATNPLGQGDFIRTLGYDQGPAAFKSYAAQLKLSNDISTLARQSPEQQDEMLAGYAPQPGDGFAEQAQRQDQMRKAITAVRKERDDDPARFAISRIPSVQDSFGTLNEVLRNPATQPAEQQAAARDFVNKTTMEQAKAGVAPANIRVLPQAYVDDLKARLTSPQTAGGTANVAQAIQKEADLWGNNWPTVYRQIAKEVGPLARVIGSGINESAARILTELGPQKIGDILKDDDKEKDSQIKKDVLESFQPLLKSMAANEGGLAVFNDFRSQAEKLSAFYVVNGSSSADAGKRAFKELVGDKYSFSNDGWRVPKDQIIPLIDIQVGTMQAMVDIDKIGIMPPRDDVGGLSKEYLLKTKIDAIRRDGKWVTAPDESGLALVLNEEAVRGADGKPLIMQWARLGNIADQVKRSQIDMYDSPPRGSF
ncbi:MAG: hypothetical protein V4673_14575 [Pseudomonadota bacterium]